MPQRDWILALAHVSSQFKPQSFDAPRPCVDWLRHVCEPKLCTFATFHSLVVCLGSGCVHSCLPSTCDRKVQTAESIKCELSGRDFDYIDCTPEYDGSSGYSYCGEGLLQPDLKGARHCYLVSRVEADKRRKVKRAEAKAQLQASNEPAEPPPQALDQARAPVAAPRQLQVAQPQPGSAGPAPRSRADRRRAHQSSHAVAAAGTRAQRVDRVALEGQASALLSGLEKPGAQLQLPVRQLVVKSVVDLWCDVVQTAYYLEHRNQYRFNYHCFSSFIEMSDGLALSSRQFLPQVPELELAIVSRKDVIRASNRCKQHRGDAASCPPAPKYKPTKVTRATTFLKTCLQQVAAS